MPKKSSPPNPFVGLWNIASMSEWDEQYIHEDGQAYIKFDERGNGEFKFGYVQGFMDCQVTTRDGMPAVEWSWEGNDESDATHGRGWAILNGKELQGMIFFYQGDNSEFVAKKSNKKAKS